jgi:hypothetical protein
MSTTPERRRIARESRDPTPSGWWNVARRVKDDDAADNVSMIAAGAALFALPALFRGVLIGAEINAELAGAREPSAPWRDARDRRLARR